MTEEEAKRRGCKGEAEMGASGEGSEGESQKAGDGSSCKGRAFERGKIFERGTRHSHPREKGPRQAFPSLARKK